MIAGVNCDSQEQLAGRFIHRVEALGQRLNIPRGLTELQEEDFDAIAKNALKEARSFYAVPRLMNRAQCKEILKGIAQEATVTKPHPASQISPTTKQVPVAV